MQGHYDIDMNSLKTYTGEYIYLGALQNHWGQFLVHTSTRIYFAIKNLELPCIFLCPFDENNMKLIDQISRFLQLAGITNYILLSHPAKFEKIIIPEQSYVTGKYVTNDYKSTFEIIANRIKPTTTKTYDCIYYSRRQFNKFRESKEIGTLLLDEIFLNQEFKTVYPEYTSLDDQIFLLKNADTIAGVEGTIFHNIVFCTASPHRTLIVNKMSYINSFLIDLLNILNVAPTFLDFYEMRYPTQVGIGPYLFIKNKYVEKYCKDFGIDLVNLYSASEEYMRTCVHLYCYRYQKIWSNPPLSPIINVNNQDALYFDPTLISEWISEFSYLEPKVQDPFININEYQSIIENYPIKSINSDKSIPIKYQTHIAKEGWLNIVGSPSTSGLINRMLPITNMRIFTLDTSIKIFFNFYYGDSGWSVTHLSNENDNNKFDNRIIDGIKIWLDRGLQNMSIFYRVFSTKWSKWHKNGEEIIPEYLFRGIQLMLIKS